MSDTTAYRLDILSVSDHDDSARVDLQIDFASRPTTGVNINVGKGLVRVLRVDSPGNVSLGSAAETDDKELGLLFGSDGVGPPMARVSLETPVTKGYGWFRKTVAVHWGKSTANAPMQVIVRTDSTPALAGDYSCDASKCERTEELPFEVMDAPLAGSSEWAGLSVAAVLLVAFVALAWRRLDALKFQLLTFRGVPEEEEEEHKPDRHHPYRGGRPQPKVDPNQILPAEALFIVRARVAFALVSLLSGIALAGLWPGGHAMIPRSWILAVVTLVGALGGARFLSSVFVSRSSMWSALLAQVAIAGYLIGWATPLGVATVAGSLLACAAVVVVVVSGVLLVATGHADVLTSPSRLDLDRDRATALANAIPPAPSDG